MAWLLSDNFVFADAKAMHDFLLDLIFRLGSDFNPLMPGGNKKVTHT